MDNKTYSEIQEGLDHEQRVEFSGELIELKSDMETLAEESEEYANSIRRFLNDEITLGENEEVIENTEVLNGLSR